MPANPLRVTTATAVVCLLLLLTGLASWPLAADVEPDAVDLTLGHSTREFTNVVGMKLVRIPRGKFTMGAAQTETGSGNHEWPRHPVELTKDFYLGVHEVTQKQYKAVMNASPSFFSKTGGGANQVANVNTDDFPVDQVSWDDAQEFCKKLSALPAERSAGRVYRLATEAEWEYACRGGDVKEPFSFDKPSDTMAATQANYSGANLQRTCKVGSYKANRFGLCDMHGNLLEWCQDWYSATTYSEKDRKDPQGPKNGQYRLLRGGSWNYPSQSCRSGFRTHAQGNYRANFIGFRVACDAR